MIVKNGTVILPDEVLVHTDIRIDGDRITGMGKFDSRDEMTMDAAGKYVMPGFVDIHTHGGGGGDFMDAGHASIASALDFHARNGTTSLLATSVTAPVSDIEAMIAAVKDYIGSVNDRIECKIRGVHLEGPYLSLKNKGAQSETHLRVPARDSYDFILRHSDIVKTVTIAPELEGAAEMTASLVKRHIVVCGGHDDGEKTAIMQAIEAGLSHCTHLWCAMSSVAIRNGVRSVGLCELGLTDDRLSVEMIADNRHITEDMAKLIYRCKGADKVCVVSDCLRAGGLEEGDTLYRLGSAKDPGAQQFLVADGAARLPDYSHLAGSVQPISQMIRNLVCGCGIKLTDAVKMGSLSPARVIGADSEIGSIAIGKKADLCLMDPELQVVSTMIDGRLYQPL